MPLTPTARVSACHGVPHVAPVVQRGQDVVAVGLHHRQPGHLVPGQQLAAPPRPSGRSSARRGGGAARRARPGRPAARTRTRGPSPASAAGCRPAPAPFLLAPPAPAAAATCRPGTRADRRRRPDRRRRGRLRSPARPGPRRPPRPRRAWPRPGRRRTARPAAAPAGVSRSQLHSTTARSVRCRGRAVRLPPVSSRKRSFSRRAISASGSVLSLAAASSIASGSPSRRRTMSMTRATVSSLTSKPGLTAAARSANSRTAGKPTASCGGHAGQGLAERRDRQQRLAGDAERLAAGGDDPQPRAVAEQLVGQVRAGVDEVLAVVEHEQGVGVGQAVEQPGSRVPAGRPLSAVEQRPRLPQADRAEHRLRHVGRVGDRGELGQPDPVGDVVRRRARSGRNRRCRGHRRHLGRQPGLAGPARADQRHQPVLLQRLEHPGDVILAPDEAGQLRPQVRPGSAGCQPSHPCWRPPPRCLPA